MTDHSRPHKAFHNIREQMYSPEARLCYDILYQHFPDTPVAVNLEAGYLDQGSGGTGIVNYNMFLPEAQSVIDSLEEIDCGCIFICPVPVSGLFTEQYLGIGRGNSELASRTLRQTHAAFVDPRVKFPPYFSIHMIGAEWKGECRAMLKQVLLQNLLARQPSSAAEELTRATDILKKFTLSR